MASVKIRLVVKILIAAVLPTVAAMSNAADARTSDRMHPISVELERRYKEYLTAGRAGDVERYRALVAPQYHGDLAGLTPQGLKVHVQTDFDPAEYQFHSIETRKDLARAIYVKKTPEASMWQGVMFHRAKEGWRVGAMVAIVESVKPQVPAESRPKHWKEGLDELLSQPMMQLPK